MPLYCFRNQADGEVVEEVFPIGKAPKRIHRDGKHYIRDIAAEHNCRAHVSGGAWPKVSEFDGCHPSQIQEWREFDKKSGVRGCDYTPEGNVKYGTAQARRDWLKAHGRIDRRAFC